MVHSADTFFQADQLLFVFNHGGNADSNGFADADGDTSHRALIMVPDDGCSSNGYQRLWAMEFRYQGPRERYLMRRLDPDTLTPIEETWSPYDHRIPRANLDGSGAEQVLFDPALSSEWLAVSPAVGRR